MIFITNKRKFSNLNINSYSEKAAVYADNLNQIAKYYVIILYLILGVVSKTHISTDKLSQLDMSKSIHYLGFYIPVNQILTDNFSPTSDIKIFCTDIKMTGKNNNLPSLQALFLQTLLFPIQERLHIPKNAFKNKELLLDEAQEFFSNDLLRKACQNFIFEVEQTYNNSELMVTENGFAAILKNVSSFNHSERYQLVALFLKLLLELVLSDGNLSYKDQVKLNQIGTALSKIT